VAKIIDKINKRPRKCLGFKTPHQLFIGDNQHVALASWIRECFSKDSREIFEHFKFGEFIAQLSDANLLYKAVQQIKGADLRPEAVSNHDMGLVFEELK